MHDKRQFNRIPLSLPAQLTLGQHNVPAQLEDISINGMRLSLEKESQLSLNDGALFTISFRVNDDAPLISMQCAMSYSASEEQNVKVIGCHLVAIDIDNFTSLRQLILHNAPSPDMSEADVQALVDAIYAKASSASFS